MEMKMQMKLKQLRIVRVPVYECASCGFLFDNDSMRPIIGVTGARFCPNDRAPLTPTYTSIEVG